MQVKELGHIVLYVRDLERSVRFYRDVLGFEEIGRMWGSAAAFVAGAHRTHHELLLIEVGEDAPPVPPGRRLGLYHFGLKVGDSLDELRAARDAVVAAGTRIMGASDHTVSQSLYILDPDGNEIELYVDADPALWRENPAAVMSPIRPLVL
jgi:catechol 2,3-dioxygenase